MSTARGRIKELETNVLEMEKELRDAGRLTGENLENDRIRELEAEICAAKAALSKSYKEALQSKQSSNRD